VGLLPAAGSAPSVVRSASGQFSVLPGESARRTAGAAFLEQADLLHLEPTLLTVSAERLRQHLTRELQDATPWQGHIRFTLRNTYSFEAPVQVVAQWQGSRWDYDVSLPDYIARDRFVRALVEVNLMEIANRGAAGRAAEIPPWLTEGLTAQLMVSRSIEIILPPPKLQWRGMHVTPWVVEELNYQPLALAHAQLQTNTPLTLEQLSWPEPGAFEGRKGVAFRHCSHLLVTRLLQLPDGPALMNRFLRSLGRHYNWQVAFLNTYRETFPTLLDAEKWWALEVGHFTGRELGATYPYAESVDRLRRAVRFPVEVRLSTNDLPMRGDVPLQVILEEWESNRQRRALEQTLTDLNLLRARIAPELIPLLDDYRQSLGDYLKNRNRSGLYLPKGMNRQIALTQLMRRTIRRLNELDAELATHLQPPPGEAALADSPD
jgi:hypothetical protein